MTVVALGPAAAADLRRVDERYEAAEVGLGDRFVEALDELFTRLEAFPRSAPRVAGYDDIRRAIVRGFPYVVFYRERPGRIEVLRVLHAARSDADQPPGRGPDDR